MTSYSNARNNPQGAVPVYIVAPPTPSTNPPNMQNNAQGAIPVNIIAQGSSPISGPIPVRVVAGPGTPDSKGRFPNDQGNNAGAIPVYQSISPKAMPVWRVN